MENEPSNSRQAAGGQRKGGAPGSACAGQTGWCAARAGSSLPHRWYSETASGKALCYFSEETKKKKKMRKGSLGNTEFSHVLTKRGASPFPWQGPGSS